MKNKKKKKPPKPPKLKKPKAKNEASKIKLPWKQRMTISGMLLVTVLTAIMLAGGVAGIYALNIVYKNKLVDTWAILFLELESQGNRLVNRLEGFHSPGRDQQKPDVILQVQKSGRITKIQGDFPSEIAVNELHLSTTKLDTKWTVLQFSGEQYLTIAVSHLSISRQLKKPVPKGVYYLLWKIDFNQWLVDSVKDVTKNTLYIISKQGRLLYSNEDTIDQTNYIERSLVQKFISAPLNQGQLEFESSEGAAFGFYYEVPNTNIVMFVETLKSIAFSSVKDLAIHFLIVLFFILGVVGILLQFPLSSLIAPMKELVRLAADVGDGNFNIRPKQEGFGELRVLSNSFSEMAKSLNVRDERINLLLIEQQEKLRLVNELAIAQSIQDNFLFKSKLPDESGLEVAAQYTPAEEVAGDWYGYFYNEATTETVFAIADVSGHGAGSAMFTAIIAATFEETRARSVMLDTFPMEDFVRRLNRLIMKLGHGDIHATLLMAKYKKGENEVEFINAGHTFPLLISPKEDGKRPEPVLLRSDLLGISLDFFPVCKKIPFPSGTSILMFTDGLIEGSPDNRLYKDKRLADVAQIESHQHVKQMIENVYEDWQEYLKGQSAKDDLCLLAIRAVA